MENREEPRIYVIGAGFAGQSIAREIKARGVLGHVVAFLDDDPVKIGRRLDEIPVLGPIRDVVNLLRRTPADEAIIAIPSASRDFLRDLYGLLKKAGFVRIRIVPGIAQIVEGDAHLIQAREIDPQDLLGRGPVVIGLKKSLSYLRDKRVLVTGAGGSIGSELARQLLSAGVQRLYLFGHGENSIYQIDRELRLLRRAVSASVRTLFRSSGSSRTTLHGAHSQASEGGRDFHTAAYKHVPMMEENPSRRSKTMFSAHGISWRARGARGSSDSCSYPRTRPWIPYAYTERPS
jgi:FlaA1/EpsC-like NDP-sugar epimerase